MVTVPFTIQFFDHLIVRNTVGDALYQGHNKGPTKSEDLSVVSCAINKTTELLLRKQFVGGI